jgi:hypothetical protein
MVTVVVLVPVHDPLVAVTVYGVVEDGDTIIELVVGPVFHV